MSKPEPRPPRQFAQYKNQGDEVQVDGAKGYSTYINASHADFGPNKGNSTTAAEAPTETANA